MAAELKLPANRGVNAIHRQVAHALVMAERTGPLHARTAGHLVRQADFGRILSAAPVHMGGSEQRNHRHAEGRGKKAGAAVGADQQAAAANAGLGQANR